MRKKLVIIVMVILLLLIGTEGSYRFGLLPIVSDKEVIKVKSDKNIKESQQVGN